MLLASVLFVVPLLFLSCGEKPPTDDHSVPVPDSSSGVTGGDGESTTQYSNNSLKTSPPPSIVDSAQASIDQSLGGVLNLHAIKPIKDGNNTWTPDSVTFDGKVMVAISFDDGPHTARLGVGRNYTEMVLDTLRSNSVQDNIKAMFCVQTHVRNRGGDTVGQKLIEMMGEDGHEVAVHTGSTADHVNHKTRVVQAAYDANGDGIIDQEDGVNALDCDMTRAMERITQITGNPPKYVRPTYGSNNAATRAVYEKHGLKMLLWDIDSEDSLAKYEPGADLAAALRKKIAQRVSRGHSTLLVLFHDIKSGTALSLDDYLIAIYQGAQDAGKEAVFPTTNEDLNKILESY